MSYKNSFTILLDTSHNIILLCTCTFLWLSLFYPDKEEVCSDRSVLGCSTLGSITLADKVWTV